jgi:uncharacterized protein (DUF983 family)
MDGVQAGRIEAGGCGNVEAVRSVPAAMARGAMHRCPACGQGGLFRAYLKVRDHCPACGEELFHHRADDAPPYVTIFVVGHLIVGAVIGIDMAYGWPMWLHALVWFPLTVGACLAFLPAAKGALIGLQWALRMHGFGGEDQKGLAAPQRHVVLDQRPAEFPPRVV